jgi:hypothetical protein
MSQDSSNRKFRKILFWFTTIFLVGHIVFTAQCIFIKADILPGKLNAFYKKLIVLGPFFMETRIVSSPHLYVSYLSNDGKWSAFQDMGKENFTEFQEHPWRYNKSKWSEYERYVTRKAYNEIHSLKYIDGSEGIASSELIQYVSSQYPQSDSVRLVYLWNTWQPESQTNKTDTGFHVIFKPKLNEVSE